MQLDNLKPQQESPFSGRSGWHHILSFWECVQLVYASVSERRLRIQHADFLKLINVANIGIREESYHSRVLTPFEFAEDILDSFGWELKYETTVEKQTLENFAKVASATFFDLDVYVQTEVGGRSIKTPHPLCSQLTSANPLFEGREWGNRRTKGKKNIR
jgi:hypothetical protein